MNTLLSAIENKQRASLCSLQTSIVDSKTSFEKSNSSITYAAFTLSGFDDQERNLMFVKTAFQVLKLKFLVYSMKQAFYSLHKQNIART